MTEIKNKIAVLIPFFGPWPDWIDYFLHSCSANDEIDWFFPSDSPAPPIKAENLRFIPFTLEEFNETASRKLEMEINIKHPYKICEFKPAYAVIFSDLLKGYDFWGYGDLDLVYGRIAEFITDYKLDNFDIISNHPDFISGHFCLLRNTLEINELFKFGGNYKTAFQHEFYTGFDEQLKRKRINPHPRFLQRENMLDRKVHVIKYKLGRHIRMLKPIFSRLWRDEDGSQTINDFTRIVKSAEKRHALRVSRQKTFESDLMLSKKEIRNWKIKWERGILTNTEGNELLYFHFILSKHKKSFRIMKANPDLIEFTLSPDGISCLSNES